MAKQKVARELNEMLSRLENQLALLESYAQKAFVERDPKYCAEVATKLRVLLVRSRHNVPLLLELIDRLGMQVTLTLAPGPFPPPPGEKQTMSLDEFFDREACSICVEDQMVSVSKRQLIRAWSEQEGGSHEDWSVEPWLRNALLPIFTIGGLHPSQMELRNSSRTALRYGKEVLAHARTRSPEGDA